MSLSVREVDLATETPRLVDVFNRGFNMNLPRERFDWLYGRNPDGRATAWFVVDDRLEEVAGCTAVFPRRIQVRGQRTAVVGWNCGDFCILPRYRLGIAAVRLRQAARDGIDAGVRPFLYAHPNNRMLEIHKRVGHVPLGRMIRLARPTKLSGQGPLSRVGTMALRAVRVDRWSARMDDCAIESQTLPRELDTLFDRLRPSLGTALVRDVDYLTWRFLDCPLQKYQFVLARRASSVVGYLAFGIINEQLQIKDWLGADDRAVRSLFITAVDEAFAAGATSASVTLLETHRDRPLIARLGFGVRPEVSTSITYASASLPWRDDVMSADAWYMTVGDRDV